MSVNRKDSIFESTSYYHWRFPGTCQLEFERCRISCYEHNTLRADYGSCSTYSMVSPWHPGHPIMGIPPVYSRRNLAAPRATSMMASLTSISALQTGQRERYASGGGPNGASRAAGRIGS